MHYLSRNPEVSQVAVAGSRLVGAVLAGHDGRRGFLYHLAVAKSHRGQSIGRELTSRSIEVLRRGGVRRVLILVARDNDTGRQFWLKQGWEVLAFAEPMGLDI
jgi:ribosomal protein S18 acetylase RimI-like enzyme